MIEVANSSEMPARGLDLGNLCRGTKKAIGVQDQSPDVLALAELEEADHVRDDVNADP